MDENTRSLLDHNYAAILQMTKAVESQKTVADVSQYKSEWLGTEDHSILQVIKDQQGLPLSLTTLKPGHIPNWDLAADAVNSLSQTYKSAKNCKARFENILSKEGNKIRGTYNNLYQADRNAGYTSIFLKRCKKIAELAEKRKDQAESVQIQNQQQQKVQLTTAQILAQAQLQQVQPQQVSITGSPGTVVKTGTAPSFVAIPISAVTMGSVNSNVSLPQSKSGVHMKGATTITNQQSRQLKLQQQLLNQAKKGSKVVTATPSLPGRQHIVTTLCVEPDVVASSVKAQTTTLSSTTLTTSNVLKGTQGVIVGQQQTAAIQQQVAASSTGITGQHAVTLAVRATASQAQGQEVQIQVQPSAHYFLVIPQAQVVMPQMQQLPQNAPTINIAPPVAVQNIPQASSILSPSGTIVQQMPADSTIQPSTHVMMPLAIQHPQTQHCQAPRQHLFKQ